jgi:hypothetical protein
MTTPASKDRSPGAPEVFDVWKDTEGVRMALEEIFESDFMRSRVRRDAEGASPETVERMERQIPPRTLAWGYYRFAEYLLHLDELRDAGIPLALAEMASCEAEGLLALHRARAAFQGRHPACSACGARQQNRFGTECPSCGTKFQRKKN